MNELQKTAIHVAAAALLCAAAVGLGRPGAKKVPPVFDQQGQPFFPAFGDWSAATSLEVVDFDAEKREPIPFKVELKDGVWRIPSKHDYPADAKEKLGKVAATLIGLKREAFRSNLEDDHKACGVVDPQAELDKPLEGRGRRVTLKDKDGKVLADLILGKKLENEPEKRFVRLAEDKYVYAVKLELDVSTEFSDWIETDFLQLDVAAVTTLTHEAYTIDEKQIRLGRLYVDKQDTVVLGQKGWNEWTLAEGVPEGKRVKMETVDKLTGALDQLKIKDVLPFSPDDMSLAGFFYIPAEKKVYSNEGELLVDTKAGLRYTLRFGEAAPTPPGETGIRRYAIVSVDPRYEALSDPADAAAKKHADEEVARLQQRFEQWYYVISAESYEALKPKREDLLEDKPKEPPPGEHDGHEHGPGEEHPDDESFFAPPPGEGMPPGETAPVDTRTPPPGEAPPAEAHPPAEMPPPGEGTPGPGGDVAPVETRAPEATPPEAPAPAPEAPAPPPETPAPAPETPAPPPETPAPAPETPLPPPETPPGDVAPIESPSTPVETPPGEVAPVESPR